MKTDLVLICALVLLAIAAFGIGSYLAHVRERRRRALRYSLHRREAPSSTVCPKCRRRSYSRRDVADHYCTPCDLHYGAPAPREALQS